MPPVWRCVSRQSHLAAFERGASKRPPARVPQGPSDDVSCREMARLSKSREERHAWSDRYAAEAYDSPLRTGRTEREHVASWFGVNPTTGSGAHSRQLGGQQQQRQGLPWPAAKRRAAALGGGGGRRRRGRREGLSRRRSLWRPARGLPGRGGGDPLGYGELASPRAEVPLRPSRPGSPQRHWWGAVTSGGEGVGPSFVPCRMGGVRLRLSRELSHKSASDKVFETLRIGLFKLERHPWYPDQGHQCKLERPGCSSSLSPRRRSSKQKPDRGGLQWTASA